PARLRPGQNPFPREIPMQASGHDPLSSRVSGQAAVDTPGQRELLLRDARAIAALGGPLLANNLSITGMSFADTVMAGQLGARDLAGLAVGAAYYNLFLFIGLGLLMSISPSVAHAFGASD